MRNLKRALSLALAAVMLLGMMVVGTSAVSVDGFTDADEITNLEAASVTTAIGIFAGYDDGSFGADDYVTRAQMATIICKILNGSNVNADIFKGVGKFQDLDDAAWAEGFINMCYSMGIIAGTSDTTFDPNRPVRTWEASLMLQRALGWWAANDPANSTIGELTVTTKGTALNMYGDLTLLPTEYLTRNDVAEMVYHTIVDCVPVAYNESFALYRNASSTNFFSGVEYAYNDTLAYQTFGLVYMADEDNFGRPATTWGYGKLDTTAGTGDIDIDGHIKSNYNKLTTALTTVVDTPVLEYTTTVTGRTLYSDLGLRANTNLPLVVDGLAVYSNAVEDDPSTDGVDESADAVYYKVPVSRTSDTPLYGDHSFGPFTGNGILTQVFKIEAENDGDPEYKVVVVRTYLMRVASVAEVTRTNPTAYVTVGNTTEIFGSKSGSYAHAGLRDSNYNTSEFERDDVVLVTMALDDRDLVPNAVSNQYKIQSMELAENFTGIMTRFTERTGTMAVDGVTYTFSATATKDANEYNEAQAAKIGLPVTIYMDSHGYAIQVSGEVADSVTNYALVLAVDTDSATVFNTNSAWAQLLLTDGSIVETKISWSNNHATAGEWTYNELANRGEDGKSLTGANQIRAIGTASASYVRDWIEPNATKTSLVENIQTLVSYDKNSNGTYTLYKLDDTGNDTWTGVTTDNNRSRIYNYSDHTDIIYTNDNTVMIVDKGNGKYDIQVGVSNLPTIDATGTSTQIALNGSSGTLARVIYTTAKPASGSTSNDDIIYLVAKGDWYYDVNDNACIPFTAVINGEVREIIVEGKLVSEMGGTAGVVEPKSPIIQVGGIYKSMTESNGIVTGMTLASSPADYEEVATNFHAVDAGVFGVGTGASTVWYTWNTGAPFVYITKNGGNVVAYPVDVRNLPDDAAAKVIYALSADTDHAGEVIWAYVIDGEYAGEIGIVSAGTSQTYNIGSLKVGDVIKVNDETAVIGEKTGGGADVAGAVGTLSIDDYTLSVNSDGKLVITGATNNQDFTDIEVKVGTATTVSGTTASAVAAATKATANITLGSTVTTATLGGQTITVTPGTAGSGEVTVGTQAFSWAYDKDTCVLSVEAKEAGSAGNGVTLSGEGASGTESGETANGKDKANEGKDYDLNDLTGVNAIVVAGKLYSVNTNAATTLSGLTVAKCTVDLTSTAGHLIVRPTDTGTLEDATISVAKIAYGDAISGT